MGPPYGSPSWGPQQPPGPPTRGNGLKWVLGAVVLLVVVAVTVGATLLFTGSGSGDNPPTGTSSNADPPMLRQISRAPNDNGPVRDHYRGSDVRSVGPHRRHACRSEQRKGWDKRDPVGSRRPHGHPTQRASIEAVGRSDASCGRSNRTPWRNSRRTALCASCMNSSSPTRARTPIGSPPTSLSDEHLAGVSNNLACCGDLDLRCDLVRFCRGAWATRAINGCSFNSCVRPATRTNPQPFLRSVRLPM